MHNVVKFIIFTRWFECVIKGSISSVKNESSNVGIKKNNHHSEGAIFSRNNRLRLQKTSQNHDTGITSK